ncbi:MAG: hypothetical protein J6W75_02750 [Bacteroidaceae bacterium]|nr:hypothetical protein [Bacteroidaceae bacterium]
MKKTYISPALSTTKMGVENMIAISGPETSNTAAIQDNGMDVKAYNYNGKAGSVNWEDDWK